MITLGNEQLARGEYAGLIRDRRVGLITNHSGVDSQLRATVDRLHGDASCRLTALFGPEHGVRGHVADGAAVADGIDPDTGVPVHSLYGATQQPTPAMLANIDVMLFDIQDVGARFYTYLYTMSLSMEASAACGLPFVVLDRPNPLGGQAMAGPLLEPGLASFVGKYPIPIQHGLTIGELALLFNAEYGIGVDLHVVPMADWERHCQWEETGLAWVPPSPNMPTVETAVVYPGTCLFEGTNVSEGRGTTKPFEQVGAPFIEARRLANHLNALELPGVRFRPVHFQPAAGKHAGAECQGVQIHIRHRAAYEAVRTGLQMLAAVRRLWPADFQWRVPSGGIYNFDRLAGTTSVREQLDQGVSVTDMTAAWQPDLQRFAELRQDYLLYHP